MTAKRSADGTLEIIKQGFGTQTFRMALLAAFLSQTPLADGVWSTFGMDSLSVRMGRVTESAKSVAADVTELKVDVEGLKKDIAGLKANNAIVSAKVDQLDASFTGFRVDFQNYKKQNP